MDVVYNHTAEGSELGPTLSFRGIDNASYYRLADHAPPNYQPRLAATLRKLLSTSRFIWR